MNELVKRLNRAVSGEDYLAAADFLAEQMELFKPYDKTSRGAPYADIALEYIAFTLDAICDSWSKEKNFAEGYRLNLTKLRDQFTYRYKVHGTVQYWSSWLEQHYPLFKILNNGNIYKGLTEVQPFVNDSAVMGLNISYNGDDVVIRPYAHLTVEDPQNDPQDPKVSEGTDEVVVDLKGLRELMIDLEHTIVNPKWQHIRHKCQAEYDYARKILSLFPKEEAKGKLPMKYSIRASGRKYYKGINLQNCPKRVRHVALGHCYEYDLNCAMWRWKLLKTVELGRKAGISEMQLHAATRGFRAMLGEKDQLRNDIADSVFIDPWGEKTSRNTKIKRVKTALSAVGFGCDLTDHPKGVLALTLGGGQYSALRAALFTDNAYVRDLITGNAVLQELIRSEYSNCQGQLDRQRIEQLLQKALVGGVPKNRDKPRKLTDSAILRMLESYLYQQWESEVIEEFGTHCDDSVILHVHDCVYTAKQLTQPSDVTVRLIDRYDMRDRPLAQYEFWSRAGNVFSATEHAQYYSRTRASYIHRGHQMDIEDEQRRSRNYTGQFCDAGSLEYINSIPKPYTAELNTTAYYGDNYFPTTYSKSL